MSNIRVAFGRPQKFILVSVAEGDGFVDVLWGDPEAEWHKDIYDQMISAGYAVRDVYGGGRIFIDPDAKEIFVWGTSDRYGLVPRYLVESMLEDEFPEYKLNFNQEPNN